MSVFEKLQQTRLRKVKSMPLFQRLLYWIEERELVRQRRAQAELPPWTTDPILSSWRFCNVHRNDDKVTKWLFDNWVRPHYKIDKEHLWFPCMIGRLINQPETLEAFDYWEPDEAEDWLEGHRTLMAEMFAAGNRVWNGAYIVSTNGRKMDKITYVFDHVLKPAWEQRDKVSKRILNCTEACKQLTSLNGIQTFMAGQIIGDWKYFGKKPNDFHTFAVPGPGSKKGLNYVLGNPPKKSWSDKVWIEQFEVLHNRVNRTYHITGQDLQNCLCEFSKYNAMLVGDRDRLKSSYKQRLDEEY